MYRNREGEIASYKKSCSYCTKVCDNPKRCGQCKMVRYCSKECQRAAWPTHKNGCSPRLVEDMAEDPELHGLNTAFTNWLNSWKYMLNGWALQTLDIYGHNQDYNRCKTHAMVLYIDHRKDGNVTGPGSAFELVKGVVMSWDDFLDSEIQKGTPAEDLEPYRAPLPDCTVRWTVICCDRLFRQLSYCVDKFSEPKPWKHVDNWEENLKELILKGLPFPL